MPETPITLKPAPRTKVPVRPKPVLKGWVSEYLPGKGGDANLLIMFHGLGEKIIFTLSWSSSRGDANTSRRHPPPIRAARAADAAAIHGRSEPTGTGSVSQHHVLH
jgi:hypothetical protein